MTSGDIISTAIQVLIAVGGGAVIIQLLTLRQTKRKITGEASTSEANAATQLANAAMSIVDSERKDKAALRDELLKIRTERDVLEAKVDEFNRYQQVLIRELARANVPIPEGHAGR